MSDETEKSAEQIAAEKAAAQARAEATKRAKLREPVTIVNASDDLLMVGENYLFPQNRRTVTRAQATIAKKRHGKRLQIKK